MGIGPRHGAIDGSLHAKATPEAIDIPQMNSRSRRQTSHRDVDRKMAVDTRKRLLDRAAADKMLIQAMHFPFPANGHIVKDGTGYRFIPTAWSHLL
jgi:hypothetical protein